MSNAEHLASVMVQAFIDAVDRGVDLVPVVADSRQRPKSRRLLNSSPGVW